MHKYSIFKSVVAILCLSIVFSCKKETTISFSEFSILKENDALVEINIPKAEGNSEASKTINNTLNHFVFKTLNEDVSEDDTRTLEEHIAIFNSAYTAFKNQVSTEDSKELPAWETIVDGELIYKNESLICISMSANKNTGGAHGSMLLKFFNFDIKTGQELKTTDLITDIAGFTALAETYFDKERLQENNDNPFPVDDPVFELPEQIGFNEEGVIIVLYDTTMPTAEYSEFVVPYEEANAFLK